MAIFLYLGHRQAVLDQVGAGQTGLEDAEMSHLLSRYLETSQILHLVIGNCNYPPKNTFPKVTILRIILEIYPINLINLYFNDPGFAKASSCDI